MRPVVRSPVRARHCNLYIVRLSRKAKLRKPVPASTTPACGSDPKSGLVLRPVVVNALVAVNEVALRRPG